MEQNKVNDQYVADLEKRIEVLQELVDKEVHERIKQNKKYTKAFHTLLKDSSQVRKVSSLLELASREQHGDNIITVGREELAEMIKTLDDFSKKYRDKTFSFLKEIIND